VRFFADSETGFVRGVRKFSFAAFRLFIGDHARRRRLEVFVTAAGFSAIVAGAGSAFHFSLSLSRKIAATDFTAGLFPAQVSNHISRVGGGNS